MKKHFTVLAFALIGTVAAFTFGRGTMASQIADCVSTPIIVGDRVIVTSQVASPAAARGRIILRSDNRVFAVGER